MGNLIDLAERLETWNLAYFDDNGIQVHVSSRGRFKISVNGGVAYTNMVDSVNLLGKLSEELEKQMGVLFQEEPATVVKLG